LEQKYIDKLKPEYNILTIAGSNRGHKLSEETKLKMSIAKKGKTSNRKGTIHNLYSKNLMKLNNGRNKMVYVFDLNKKLINNFRSITSCSVELNISYLRIRTAIKNNKLVNNTYYFSHSSKLN
jgi:NUMOD1 domain-containing protein/NUMOD3 motif-containing protein